MQQRVCVFGMGYVGCVTAACLARDGHFVVGVDIDEGKVATINAGRTPVHEPGLEDLLREQVEAGRLQATTDVAAAVQSADIALVAVGTPSDRDGSVKSNAVEGVVADIGQALQGSEKPFVVVVRSTILPGILEERLQPRLEAALGEPLGDRVHLCNNPEFLREATAIADYQRPPFIVVGATEPSAAERVMQLYDGLASERIVTDTRTSALVKYACNAFHAAKVSFANEIGALARALGADGQEVMRIACQDRQLNISPAYLRPGFAFGGSCLPKDVRALTRYAQEQAIQVDLLSSLLPSNEAHLQRAWEMIRDSGSRRIGLIGLSFKAGTDDLRESPLVSLAETLLGKGFELSIYDPGVQVARLVGANLSYAERHLPHLARLLVEDAAEVFAGAEVIVVGSNVADDIAWPENVDIPVIDLRRDLVIAPQLDISSLPRAVS